jgi:SAM-dependent methyltransferase
VTSGKCLACGSLKRTHWAEARDVEYKSVPDRFSYHRCEECFALSIDPVPTDRLATIYPSNYYSFSAAGGGAVVRIKDWLDRRWFRSVTGPITGESISALDVGGGAGHQLSMLKRSDRRVARTVIVDLDADAQAAASAAGHEYVRANIEEAVVSGSFDIVLLLNLIEHVNDPLEVLRKVRDLLAEDGVIVIKTPNYDSLDARLFRHRDWGGYHCPRHWVLFTQASFSALAAEAGLAVSRWSYTQGAPFWTVSVLAWLDRLGIIRITPSRPVMSQPLFGPLAALFAAFDFARGLAAPLSQMTFILQRK